MSWDRFKTALQIALVLAIVSITLGQIAGQPTLVSYVTSDSMEPTISEGDGYLVVPSAVAGPVEEGDIVIFESKTLDGGGLTTHRVVDEESEGYITKGDGNPFTDQSASEPPVKDPQVVGKAIQVGDDPIVVPRLGTALGGIRAVVQGAQRSIATTIGMRSLLGTNGLAYILFGVGCLLYGGSVVVERRNGPNARRNRKGRRREFFPNGVPKRLVVLGLGLLLVLSLTVSMVAPGGVHEFGVVSAEKESSNPTVIPAGETDSVDYSVPNNGILPIVAYVDPASEGVDTPDESVRVDPGGEETVDVQLTAPDSTGFYDRYIVEYRYIAVLPESWIEVLYRLHPWLPVLVIDAIVFGVFLAVTIPTLGRGRIRKRSGRSLSRRFKRKLK